MKIPPVNTLGRFVVQKNRRKISSETTSTLLKNDTITFGSSIAYYLKKYATLPSEIKEMLSPKDAIDMFKNMELIQKGQTKGVKVGQGNHARVYQNPWLNGYYSLIIDGAMEDTQTIYSRYSLGKVIWGDEDNHAIQIIQQEKKA